MLPPAMQGLPPLLTAEEVCAQFRSIGRARLYQLARRGEIPSIKLGRALRFSAPALQAWIDAGGTAAGADVEPGR